jgi:hypothetical protein
VEAAETIKLVLHGGVFRGVEDARRIVRQTLFLSHRPELLLLLLALLLGRA